MAGEGPAIHDFSFRAASEVVDSRLEPALGRLTRGPAAMGWVAYVKTFGRWYNPASDPVP